MLHTKTVLLTMGKKKTNHEKDLTTALVVGLHTFWFIYVFIINAVLSISIYCCEQLVDLVSHLQQLIFNVFDLIVL